MAALHNSHYPYKMRSRLSALAKIPRMSRHFVRVEKDITHNSATEKVGAMKRSCKGLGCQLLLERVGEGTDADELLIDKLVDTQFR